MYQIKGLSSQWIASFSISDSPSTSIVNIFINMIHQINDKHDLLIIMLLYLFGSFFLPAKSLGCLLTSNLSLLVACSPSLSSLLSLSTIQVPKIDRCRFTNKLLMISLTFFPFGKRMVRLCYILVINFLYTISYLITNSR